jgi:hypothetical protein
MGRRREPAPPNISEVFLGYPPELVAEICAVSVGTARQYKRGTRSPSPPAMRLWELYISGRIMPDSWVQYAFNLKDQLCQRQTNFWVDEESLNGFTYRMQLLPRAQQRIHDLEAQIRQHESRLAAQSRHYLIVGSTNSADAPISELRWPVTQEA